MEQLEETELIRRIVNGDTEAFARVVERYDRRVYALVVRTVSDAEEARELTQDVFLKAFRALGSFDGRSGLATWLFRIAYNTALSHVRRRRPRHAEIDERRLAALPDEEADRLEAHAAHEHRIEALTRAVEKLTAEERALVTLFYYDDLSVAACACVTGLSEANVKVRLHRIRKKLYLLVKDSTDETDR